MRNTRRHPSRETQTTGAPVSAAGQQGSETQKLDAGSSTNDGQIKVVNQLNHAVVTGARDQQHRETQLNAVAGLSYSGRHRRNATQQEHAAEGAPDQRIDDIHHHLVGGLVITIRAAHRQRRYALKVQQKIDRALEAYVRINHTAWRGDEADAEAIRKQVASIIKAARAGELGDIDLIELVQGTDASRAPYDKLRHNTEKRMEQAAKQLPVYPWIESVRGAGALGLATIVAEVAAVKPDGSFATLSDYSSPAKVWKRLGFAPYDGHAGSTWKRATWRPRALTADEWVANPFSGERYALAIQIGTWLINAQWISAKRTGGETGEPNGPYGRIYAERRAHTARTHPEWSKGHSHSDAVRVTMKVFLRDLWQKWNGR